MLSNFCEFNLNHQLYTQVDVGYILARYNKLKYVLDDCSYGFVGGHPVRYDGTLHGILTKMANSDLVHIMKRCHVWWIYVSGPCHVARTPVCWWTL